MDTIQLKKFAGVVAGGLGFVFVISFLLASLGVGFAQNLVAAFGKAMIFIIIAPAVIIAYYIATKKFNNKTDFIFALLALFAVAGVLYFLNTFHLLNFSMTQPLQAMMNP